MFICTPFFSFSDSNPNNPPKIKCSHIETNRKETKEHHINLSKKKDRDKDKPTRVRTVLNEKQLSTLKACYAANPRPDSVMKEQLVEITGLSPRVIRVWFQNKRCKDKKRSMLLSGKDSMVRFTVLLQNLRP